MDYAKWGPLAVSLGVNLIIVGIFAGSLRQTVKSLGERLSEAITTIGRRLDAHDAIADESQVDRSNIRARLEGVERVSAGIHGISQQLIQFRAATEVEHRYMREKLDGLGRDMQSAQRQLANVAGLKSGAIHEIRGGD